MMSSPGLVDHSAATSILHSQATARVLTDRYNQVAVSVIFKSWTNMVPTKLDHCVIHVSDWERSNKFYREVMGAELVQRPVGWAYRFGDKQLNVHGPGVKPAEVARLPVQPGNSDLCFEWQGPIERAIAHLKEHGISVERGPMPRFGAKGQGTSIYFRDPDGSLMEFMSYGDQ
jgi:catechol 2,3-dioxygenase-like lactoylglutathione lyase family enzyme